MAIVNSYSAGSETTIFEHSVMDLESGLLVVGNTIAVVKPSLFGICFLTAPVSYTRSGRRPGQGVGSLVFSHKHHASISGGNSSMWG